MGTVRKRSGEWISGFGTEFKKQLQYEDIAKIEIDNAKKFLSLPARYVFQAENIVTAQGQMKEGLEEQARRVDVVMGDEADERGHPIQHRDD